MREVRETVCATCVLLCVLPREYMVPAAGRCVIGEAAGAAWVLVKDAGCPDSAGADEQSPSLMQILARLRCGCWLRRGGLWRGVGGLDGCGTALACCDGSSSFTRGRDVAADSILLLVVVPVLVATAESALTQARFSICAPCVQSPGPSSASRTGSVAGVWSMVGVSFAEFTRPHEENGDCC